MRPSAPATPAHPTGYAAARSAIEAGGCAAVTCDVFDTVVWRQFSDLHTDLWLYFEQTTERLIREAIHADTADAETAVEPSSLR